MSRPIAYNTPALAVNGSITNEDKVISYVVDGRGNDYYNGYADRLWVPSADGAAPIVFVTDTYTRGYEGDPLLSVPLFFACAGTSSAAILYTANRLPGSPGNYTDANTALNDLNRTYGYFILESNDPFQGDFQNGNLLTIDASKMTSYPQTGTNWYDMSGNGFSFSLVNGPSFQSSGWFNMDGTDDSIGLAGNTTLKTTNTLVMWLRTTDTTGLLLTGNPPGSTGGQYVAAYYPGQGFYSGAAGSPNYFMDTLATADPATPINYLDGRFHMWEVKGLSFGAWTNDWYFLSYAAGYQIAGDVAKIQMFDSSLTSAQSKQLYFGSPIVTDGLVFAVDANNIVSYPKSGTASYSLTGSITNTLTNGVGFSSINGGTWRFDGVDDYILSNSPVNENNSITIEAWIYPTGYTTVGSGGGGFILSNVSYYFEYASTGVIRSYFTGLSSPGYHNGTVNIPLNTWAHVVVVRNQSDSTIKHYVNGNLDNTISGITGNINNGAFNLQMGAYLGGGYAFIGNIPSGKIYNRALSAAEIQQNYQAEQYRFETPAGPVTNGLLLYWDAGNLDSYPGTGTTIYDLSGNGNNGTLVNGVGFNQTNGGVLTFDGVDDVVRLSSPDLRFTNNTVMGAARYNGGTRGRMINSYFNNWLMGHWGTTTQNYYAEGWVSIPGSGPSDTNWRIYSALGDVSGDSYSLYVNNSLSSGPNNGGAQGPYGISIGASGGSPGSEPSTGEFSFVLMYNRVLTAAEMTQNYNFFKGRFGL